MGRVRKDLTGQRFGKLVVIKSMGIENGKTLWLCQCDCGMDTITVIGNLNTPKGIRSCGCLVIEKSKASIAIINAKERSTIHGHAIKGKRSPTYISWDAMIQRCTNPNHKKYPLYAGTGIIVCDRWKIFSNFLEDMGERPSGTTLDRWPNKEGNYEPGNCRWATPTEQNLNRRVWKA